MVERKWPKLARRPVWLRKETRNGMDYAVVLVNERGEWHEVIRELIGVRTEKSVGEIPGIVAREE